MSASVRTRVGGIDWALVWTRDLSISAPVRTGQQRSSPDTAAKILALLTSSRHRKGSLESMDIAAFRASHIGLIARRVVSSEPILLTLIGFPFKVPNPLKVLGRRTPDLAELASIKTLCRLQLAMQRIYPPGIQVVLIHDGTHIARTFGVSAQEIGRYMDGFGNLLRLTGADAFIQSRDLAGLMHSGGHEIRYRLRSIVRETHEWATSAATASQRQTALYKTLGMINTRWVSMDKLSALHQALRYRQQLPEWFHGSILAHQVQRSMRRHHIEDLILHRFDPRMDVFPEAIHATTRCQPGRLALWLVERGRGLLPWHGVGVLRKDGSASVRWAIEVSDTSRYRPIYVEGEDTPFGYEEL